MNRDLDMAIFQNRNFISTTATFWMINSTASPASTKLMINLNCTEISPSSYALTIMNNSRNSSNIDSANIDRAAIFAC